MFLFAQIQLDATSFDMYYIKTSYPVSVFTSFPTFFCERNDILEEQESGSCSPDFVSESSIYVFVHASYTYTVCMHRAFRSLQKKESRSGKSKSESENEGKRETGTKKNRKKKRNGHRMKTN